MKKRNTSRANRRRRTRQQLSSTVKELGGYNAGDHLAKREKHDRDVLAQHEWHGKERARQFGIHPEDHDSGTGNQLAGLKFAGGTSDDAIRTVNAAMDLNHILGETGIIASLAYVGAPGQRDWCDLEGQAWVSKMMAEKEIRGNYVTTSRAHVENGPRPLEVMIIRLTPWIALEAGKALLSDSMEFKKKILRLAKEFSDRYEVDVVGVVAHRETEHDLHLHLIFSRTREQIRSRAMSQREIARRRKQAMEGIRAEQKVAGRPATNREISRIYSERVKSGAISDLATEAKYIEYQRFKPRNSSIRQNTLGHAFRCKYQIWKAADKDTKSLVAAHGDRSETNPRSFRGRLIKAEERGEDLGDFWWDLWLSERWGEICLDGLPPELAVRASETGREMASRYVRYGSSTATKLERLAVEKNELANEVQGLRNQVNHLTADKQEAEARLQCLTTENADLKQTVEQNEKRLAAREAEMLEKVRGLDAEATMLRQHCVERSEQLKQVEKKLDHRRETSGIMATRLNELKQHNAVLASENKPLREENSSVRTAFHKLSEL